MQDNLAVKRILSLDLAFKQIGASIFYGHKLIDFRCISVVSEKQSTNKILKNPKVEFVYTGGKSRYVTLDDWYNFLAVSKAIKQIIKGFNINYIIFEIPTGAQQARASKLLGATQGIMAGILSGEIDHCTISPSEVKMAACGRSKNVPKDAVIEAMKKLYPRSDMPRASKYHEHIYDSFAVMEAYKCVEKIRGSQIDRII